MNETKGIWRNMFEDGVLVRILTTTDVVTITRLSHETESSDEQRRGGGICMRTTMRRRRERGGERETGVMLYVRHHDGDKGKQSVACKKVKQSVQGDRAKIALGALYVL